MSLSFEDSLKKNAINSIVPIKNTNVVMNVDNANIDNPSIMTLNAMPMMDAYSGDDGNWIEHDGYVKFKDVNGNNIFSDNNISIVDDKKDIVLNDNQLNITQESNSQYIPFEMPRYYDGYDLVDTVISIHYEKSGGGHGCDNVIDVVYNDEKIRFAWLVDYNATTDSGELKFEIHAYGTITGSDGNPRGYMWKSKTNNSMNVLQSICECEDVANKIDDSWMQTLITDITERVVQEISEAEFGKQTARADEAATSASEAIGYAETAINLAEESLLKAEEAKIGAEEVIRNAEDFIAAAEDIVAKKSQVQIIIWEDYD